MPLRLPHIAIAAFALCPAASAFAAAPTFAHDVAPILYAHCAPCHQAGGPAPFSLLRYEDVKKRADLVVRTTRSRYMPPWRPEIFHQRPNSGMAGNLARRI
jgi:mono/diheme cytochrome c family protein